MSGEFLEREISLKKAVAILLVVALVVVGVGYAIGSYFFWKSPKLTKAERDILVARTNYEEIKKKFEAKDASEKDVVLALIDLGNVYLKYGRTQEALRYFEEARDYAKKAYEKSYNKKTGKYGKQETDTYNLARINLGTAYVLAEKYEEGVKLLQPLLKDYPYNEKLYFYYGYGNYMLGRYPEAIKALEKTVELSPGSADAYYYLALSYEKAGQKEKALNAINKALQFVPNSEEFKKVKDRLS